MGELTLKTIINAFDSAEKEFPKHMKKRIFSLPDNYAKNSNTKCKVAKTNSEEFFEFWIPESLIGCFGNSGTELTYNQVCHIIAGRKRKVAETIRYELEECPIQMFWDFKEHIEKALEWHIKVFVCIKHKGVSIFDEEKVGITVKDLTDEISSKKEVYEETMKAFKNKMLESILQSQEYLSDERITKSKFHDLLTDEKRDEIERLTILSIFGLFAAVTVENEDYYYKRIYKKIYDEKTNKLKPLPKTREKQIKIDREVIWNAGKKWYEQTKAEGNRFSKLFPDTALLPLAGTIPVYAHSTNNIDKPLMCMINETPGHLYLIGEGGIGKTTALYSIMENAYVNCEEQANQQVPLFIELSRAYKSQDFDLDRGRSEFILNTVQNQLQISLKTRADLEEQIEEEFQKDAEVPEYTLLLDGLNEVSREEIKGHVILQMVVAEIIYIMANYKNVRVILTSRSEEKLGGEAKSLYLSGIDHEQIEAFLNDKGVSPARIKKTTQNTQLMETLRIPLFLIMYAELEGEDEILSRGEILHAFFSKTNKELYSERDRIETINTEFAKETGIDRSEGSKDCITPHMLNFILEFIMPQIAWNMAKENEFQINRTGIKKTVKQVLTDKTETSFISEYGIEFFSEYLTGEDENIRTTAERIKKIFGADGSEGMDSISSGVLKCLTKQFGLLVTNDYKEYEVLHQHIRDYFAALYHINRLKLAAYINEQGDRDKAIECLSEMGREPLPGQILVFIGEALGELHNVPELKEETSEWIKKEPESGTERDLIKRNFDVFRGISNDDDNYAVWNLFQIMKLVREDLSGLDLSGLNLRRCRVNGYRLGNQTFAAKLDNAILTEEFFMPDGHSEWINSAVFSPDGKYILTASWDRTAKVWDAKTITEVPGGTLKGHKSIVISAVYSPDGKYILTASWDETAKIWDAKTFRELPGGTLVGHTNSLNSAVYSPDGKHILTSSEDGTAKIWDAKTFRELPGGTLKGQGCSLSSAEYSPDGKYILTITNVGTAKIWDAKTFKEIPGGTLKGNEIVVTYAVYSPDGKFILTTSWDKKVTIWDAKTFKEIPNRTLEGHTGKVKSILFSPDGKFIVTASEDGTVKMWDAKTFKESPCGTQNIHFETLESVVYSSDGKFILAASYSEMTVYDAKTFKKIPGRTMIGYTKKVRSATYSPDGIYILIKPYGYTFMIWDAKTIKKLQGETLEELENNIVSVTYSSDGKYILTASRDGTAKVWDAKSFKKVMERKFDEFDKVYMFAVYSPDGENILTGFMDGTAKVWDAKTFKEIPGGTLVGHREALFSAIYSPDGENILTVSADGMVKVWDAKTFKEIPCDILKDYKDTFSSAVFSPDGKCLLTVQCFGIVKLWDAKTFKEIPGGALDREYQINTAVYSPDGKYILTASEDGTVKVWDAKTFKEVPEGTLKGHTDRATSAVYSPDGKYILTASYDGTTKVWNAKNFAETYTITNVPGLEVMNVDLRELNEASNISDKTKKILKDYGAIIE